MSEIKCGCPMAGQKECIKEMCAWWIPNAEECSIAVIAVYIAGMWRDRNV